ncbi:MAG TPA: glucuronate isomerase [Acidimicrobiales bacterium]|nr:glucuronate isomerase [Acidimicrobiales bacterium]
MSQRFLDDDVLLTTPTSRQLYHDVAAALPIVDVHTHLSAEDIESDRVWTTIDELWLSADHYKWRAMRLAGVPEELITGDVDPWDRFSAWAATMPRLVRNPLYVWTHLELRRVFGIDAVLDARSAKEIWDEANRLLPSLSAQRLLAMFRVELVATTDDPSDALDAHRRLAGEATDVRMVPTFRPDQAHALLADSTAWNAWVDRLADTEHRAITDLESLLTCLMTAHARFGALGCRASDHGLARLPDRPRDPARADNVVRGAREGRAATDDERDLVMLEVVSLAARLAFADDSVLQLHLGPLRNVSPRLMDLVGRDAGADVIGDERQAPGLARFLGDLERAGTLPRTALYNVNPADNALFAAMAGAYARSGVAGLVQWGPAWWFNDTIDGIRRQLDDLGQIGQIGGFIGMLTDSRSLLSMTRHELFRRIFCDWLGRDVEAGLLPADTEMLATLVRDVSVANARAFFGFGTT